MRNLPGPPSSSLLLGNIPDLISAPVQQTLAKWAERYGKIFKIELRTVTAVIVTDPDAIHQMLKVDRFDKYTVCYNNFEKLTLDDEPNMLTMAMGPFYRAIRKAVTPAFSPANLRAFFPTLVSLTERVMKHIAAVGGEAAPLDMDRVALRLTIDVIGRFAFDRDFDATGFGRNEALEAVGDLLVAQQRMSNPLNHWFWWRKEARGLVAARRRYDTLVRRALEDLRERPPAPHSLLAHLLTFIDPTTGKLLSPKRLRCETAMLWLVGFETTAHSIGWALMFIAGNPQVESTLAAELDAAGLLAAPGRPEPRPLALSDLGSLRYLNAVIQEALRLMPPVSGGTGLECPRDTVLAGHAIPQGAMIWVPFYAMQRSVRVWGPDAEQFRPERWMSGQGAVNGGSPAAVHGGEAAEANDVVKADATQTACAWLPFGEGPRSCVGQSLALMEQRTVLAMLCGRFRFRLADEMGGVEGIVSDAQQHMILKPGNKGLLIHAIPRAP